MVIKMKAKAPNYLYPLATDRKLQWTKDVVRGEQSAFNPIKPKIFNAKKKEIIRKVIKDKTKSFSKPVKTRNNLNPMLKAKLPEDPMRAPDPRPGNAMHITNTAAAYNGYQK
jgi:non-homologous end joining protein Ku